jgi:uncharacterized protein HemX
MRDPYAPSIRPDSVKEQMKMRHEPANYKLPWFIRAHDFITKKVNTPMGRRFGFLLSATIIGLGIFSFSIDAGRHMERNAKLQIFLEEQKAQEKRRRVERKRLEREAAKARRKLEKLDQRTAAASSTTSEIQLSPILKTSEWNYEKRRNSMMPKIEIASFTLLRSW